MKTQNSKFIYHSRYEIRFKKHTIPSLMCCTLLVCFASHIIMPYFQDTHAYCVCVCSFVRSIVFHALEQRYCVA